MASYPPPRIRSDVIFSSPDWNVTDTEASATSTLSLSNAPNNSLLYNNAGTLDGSSSLIFSNGVLQTSQLSVVQSLNVKNDTLVVSENIGIHTNTPQYDLDVDGDVNISGQLLIDGQPFVSDIAVDSIPTQNSDDPVTSGGVYSALQSKVDVSVFDAFADNFGDRVAVTESDIITLNDTVNQKVNTLNPVLVGITSFYNEQDVELGYMDTLNGVLKVPRISVDDGGAQTLTITPTSILSNGNINVTPSGDPLIPSQTGQSGKFLSTDGTNTLWATVSSGGYGSITITEPTTQPVQITQTSETITNPPNTGVITINGNGNRMIWNAFPSLAGIYASSDRGATWTLSNAPTGVQYNVLLLSTTGLIGYAFRFTSPRNVYKTTDGGFTWSALSLTSSYNSPNNIYTSSSGNVVVLPQWDGKGVWYSVNGGTTFAQILGTNGNYTSGGWVSTNEQGIFQISTTASQLFVSVNGGSTWNTRTIGTGLTLGNVVSSNDATRIYVSINNSTTIRLFGSTNSGATFTNLNPTGLSSFGSGSVFVWCNGTGQIVILQSSLDSANYFISTDYGANFLTYNRNGTTIGRVYDNDLSNIYYASGTSLFQVAFSTNLYLTSSLQTSGSVTDLYVDTDITYDLINQRLALPLVSNLTATNVNVQSTGRVLMKGTDVNHGVGYYASDAQLWNNTSINGPVLFGFGGGALGTKTNSIERTALRWSDSNVVNVESLSGFSDLRVTTPNNNILYINNDKGNGGNVEVNVGSPFSNMILSNGNLQLNNGTLRIQNSAGTGLGRINFLNNTTQSACELRYKSGFVSSSSNFQPIYGVNTGEGFDLKNAFVSVRVANTTSGNWSYQENLLIYRIGTGYSWASPTGQGSNPVISFDTLGTASTPRVMIQNNNGNTACYQVKIEFFPNQ